jgi:hypothetical protein
MRPTTRRLLAALVVAGMLVVAGCAGPSNGNNSTDVEAEGEITTVAPEATPAANDGAGAAVEDGDDGDYALADVDAPV